MNKEEIYDLLNTLDLQEWCTELYKVPLTWCELYDIRDYIINFEQALDEIEKICNSIPIENTICDIGKIHDIEVIIQKAKGDEISE